METSCAVFAHLLVGFLATFRSRSAHVLLTRCVRFTVQPPRTHITDEAKFAVQSLWQACCAPTYYLDNPNDAIANAFDPDLWQAQNGGDDDRTPYCYWNPLGAAAAQHISGNGPGGPAGWDQVGPQDCELLNHVQCDADGNIAELSLSGLGLKCDQIPDLAGLSHIKNFHAANNQISGTIPIGFTVSRSLEQFQMTHNYLDGTIPCFASQNFDVLHLESNLLTGTIPACLMGKPSMEQLHLATNFLEGTIPARWGVAAGETSNLVSINLKNANLEGPIPTDISALPRVVVIDLSLNHLSGPIPPSIVQDPIALYRLHLSHNELTGTLPQVGPNMQSLKVLRVDNNHISGGITSQFDFMRQYQVDQILSSIWLQSNSFSGALPRALYSLTMGEPYIRDLDMSDNHFYCEKDTGTWPIWAMRLSSRSSIGTCEPVPRIDRIEPAEMAVGEPITVFGTGFMATDDFRCKFGTVVSDALFDSPTQARCIVPDMPGVAPGMSVVLTMANYGEDWSGPDLLSGYSPTSFTLSTSETCSGHGRANADGTCVCDSDASGQWSGERCDMKETNPFLIILLVFMAIVAVGFGIFIFVLISKEKSGDPLFMSLMEGDFDSGGGGMGGDIKMGAMGGMTVEGAEPSMPPPPASVTEL